MAACQALHSLKYTKNETDCSERKAKPWVSQFENQIPYSEKYPHFKVQNSRASYRPIVKIISKIGNRKTGKLSKKLRTRCLEAHYIRGDRGHDIVGGQVGRNETKYR